MKYLCVSHWARLWHRSPPIIKIGVLILLTSLLLSWVVSTREAIKKESLESCYKESSLSEKGEDK